MPAKKKLKAHSHLQTVRRPRQSEAERINTRSDKEDIWNVIRKSFIRELTRICDCDNHDPRVTTSAKEKAARIADKLILSVCHLGHRAMIPKLPRYLRELRNKQLLEQFNGQNYSQIGRHAPHQSVTSRQVRKILKQGKGNK